VASRRPTHGGGQQSGERRSINGHLFDSLVTPEHDVQEFGRPCAVGNVLASLCVDEPLPVRETRCVDLPELDGVDADGTVGSRATAGYDCAPQGVQRTRTWVRRLGICQGRVPLSRSRAARVGSIVSTGRSAQGGIGRHQRAARSDPRPDGTVGGIRRAACRLGSGAASAPRMESYLGPSPAGASRSAVPTGRPRCVRGGNLTGRRS
jgi:hypothetical protein